MINRREMLIRSATGCFAGLTAGKILPTSTAWAAADPLRLKVCLISGSDEYKSHETLAEFQKLIEKNYPIECSRAFKTWDDNLPGLEALDTCDVAIVFTRRLTITGDQLERVKKYCTSGRPLIGIRTASHAFQNWLDLDKEVFGGDYHNHYADGPAARIEIVDAATNHPILKHFTPYTSAAKLYKNPHVAADVTVLLTGTIPEHTEPVAWTRNYRGGKIFYTSLGDPSDFQNENFRQLLIGALAWTTGRDLVAKS
jgi:type 1 glutamine amidotransferase